MHLGVLCLCWALHRQIDYESALVFTLWLYGVPRSWTSERLGDFQIFSGHSHNPTVVYGVLMSLVDILFHEPSF